VLCVNVYRHCKIRAFLGFHVWAVPQLLLACGVEPNCKDGDGDGAVWAACRHGREDVLRILLANRGCVETLVRAPLPLDNLN
jgi:hypothetical protein